MENRGGEDRGMEEVREGVYEYIGRWGKMGEGDEKKIGGEEG
jgi:hypothetical protein